MTWGPGGTLASSKAEREYRMRIALDRDSRLNREELRVYEDTALELEYGPNFLTRAHP